MRSLNRCVWLTVTLGLLVGGLVLSGSQPVAGRSPDDKKDKKKAGDRDGKNDMKGRARWEWRMVSDKKEEVESGTFMAYLSGEIKHGEKQKLIGKYETVGQDKITAKFTEGKLKGDLSLEKTKNKPLTYKGDLTRADGSKKKIELVIIND